jgi:hypothetical protein
MSDFRARLLEERVQLHLRIEKLREFLVSRAFDGLPEIERSALKEQIIHMQNYFAVLDSRASRLCNSA